MGLSSAAQGERSRRLQLELAEAVEDHNTEAIRKLLPIAMKVGLKWTEIDAAQRVVLSEGKEALFRELREARGAVRRFTRTAVRAVDADVNLEGVVASDDDEEAEPQERVWMRLESRAASAVDT